MSKKPIIGVIAVLFAGPAYAGKGADIAQELAGELAEGVLRKNAALERFDDLERADQVELIDTWREIVAPEGMGLELFASFRGRLKKIEIVRVKGRVITKGEPKVFSSSDRARPLQIKEDDDAVKVRFSKERPSTGWAAGAAVIGFVAAGGIMALSVASELTKDNIVPSMPLGATASLMTAVFVPITYAGGRSARVQGASGSLALRVTGWIAYGVSLLGAVILGGIAGTGKEPPDGGPLVLGALAAASSVSFAVDAVMARNELISF